MDEFPRHLSAEQHRERLLAARTLRAMERHEEVAVQAETRPHAVLRQAFARRYRELIGVAPGRRDVLRAALQDIVDGSGGDVADALRWADQPNPLS